MGGGSFAHRGLQALPCGGRPCPPCARACAQKGLRRCGGDTRFPPPPPRPPLGLRHLAIGVECGRTAGALLRRPLFLGRSLRGGRLTGGQTGGRAGGRAGGGRAGGQAGGTVSPAIPPAA